VVRVFLVAFLLGAAAPVLAQVPVVGFLNSQGPTQFGRYLPAFKEGLESQGYREGDNVVVEYRWAKGDVKSLVPLATELIKGNVAVIVASGGDSSTRAAKSVTGSIPIVFGTASDPVQAGLVSSMSRPGGNATGVTLLAEPLNVKRLELARELVPSASVVAALVNPDHPRAAARSRDLETAAGKLVIQLLVLAARAELEFAPAFAVAARKGVQAVVVSIDPLFLSRRAKLIALAAEYRLPTIYPTGEFAADGGLASYGSDVAALYRQLGLLTGRILKGAHPGELPVEQPTKFDLVINLRTARALELAVPASMRVRADRVIE
jgi:putative tryptophan/tyrosine transport system substrate-binding protein